MSRAELAHRLAPLIGMARQEVEILAAIWDAGPAGILSTALPEQGSAYVVLSRLRAHLVEKAAKFAAPVRIDSVYSDGGQHRVGAGLGVRGNAASKQRGECARYVMVGGDELDRLARRQPWRPPAEWRLNGHKETACVELVKGWARGVAVGELQARLDANGSTSECDKLVWVVVTQLRKRFAPQGFMIETVKGGADPRWRFEVGTRARLANVRASYLDSLELVGGPAR